MTLTDPALWRAIIQAEHDDGHITSADVARNMPGDMPFRAVVGLLDAAWSASLLSRRLTENTRYYVLTDGGRARAARVAGIGAGR